MSVTFLPLIVGNPANELGPVGASIDRPPEIRLPFWFSQRMTLVKMFRLPAAVEVPPSPGKSRVALNGQGVDGHPDPD